MQIKQNSPLVDETEKISFIITYYNIDVDMLCQCIDSIMALSLRPSEREIIVIDDGSDVSPIEALRKYDNDIMYVRQSNQGLSAARNAGIRISTGMYIQFMDADDYLIQPAFEHCLDIVRYNNPDIVLFQLTDKESREVTVEFEGPVDGSEYMRQHNLRASACGYIFRKATLVNLRFRSGILHEDEEFTPQLILRAERLFYTEAEAYFYRKRNKSITHNDDMKWRMRRLNDMEAIILNLNDRADSLPQADREALQRRVAQLTMDYIYNYIRLTHDSKHLEKCIERLHEKGLFPLPDRHYTRKYTWFRRLSMTKIGRKLLLMSIPKQ